MMYFYNYWIYLFKTNEKYDHNQLVNFMINIMIMPSSNVYVERIFSMVNATNFMVYLKELRKFYLRFFLSF